MSKIKIDKVVSVLPATLIANTVYAVRVGSGFDLYISDTTGSIAHKINSSVLDSYNTVSQNHKAYNTTRTYNANGDLDTVVYDLGNGQSITKTINYLPNGDIDTVVLSGDTPTGIDLTKTIVYNVESHVININYN